MALTLKRIKLEMVVQALFGYHVGVVAAGLLMHPYKTVQDVVRKGIPTSSIFFPSICWGMGFLLLRVLEHFLFYLLPTLGFWWFLFVWGTMFLFLWQILLLYLFFRFTQALHV